MLLAIPQAPNENAKKFPKVIEQAAPVEGGMYKASFKHFITLGFHINDFDDEKKLKFYTNFGFELVEDMAGNPIPNHWRKFDDGSEEESPKMVFREYTLANDLHHKSNGFTIARALFPQVPTVRRGKQKEHEYIVGFDWAQYLDTTVLVQVEKKQAKESGNFYNKIMGVMPLGAELDTKVDPIMFNLYDSSQEMQDVFESDVSYFDKKKIKESLPMAGEPEVIYREEAEAQPPVVEKAAIGGAGEMPY